MGSPIGLLMVAGAAVGALVLASRSAGASSGGARAVGALVPGHRYKIVFSADDVSRNAPSFAATSGLAVRVAQLGWTRVTLQPDPSDANLFVWRAEATWTGDRPKLADGLGVRFIGVVDLDATSSGNGGQVFDPNLSSQDTQTVLAALQRETDIAKLTELANSLDPEFPIAAAALRQKIAALAAQLGGQQPPPRRDVPQTPGPGVSPVQPSQQPPVPGPLQPPVPVTPPFQPFQPPQQPQQPQQPPPPPVLPQGPQRFEPGPMPALPPIPPAGFRSTAKHRSGQLALANWAAQFQPGAFSSADADGVIGPRTQHVTQTFQAWANRFRGLNLMLDGLFGDNTYAALREFGFNA